MRDQLQTFGAKCKYLSLVTYYLLIDNLLRNFNSPPNNDQKLKPFTRAEQSSIPQVPLQASSKCQRTRTPATTPGLKRTRGASSGDSFLFHPPRMTDSTTGGVPRLHQSSQRQGFSSPGLETPCSASPVRLPRTNGSLPKTPGCATAGGLLLVTM